jgi:hypothetical protein
MDRGGITARRDRGALTNGTPGSAMRRATLGPCHGRSTPMRSRSRHPMRWILAGTLVIGSLDLLFAWTFWLQRVPSLTMGRVLQSLLYGVMTLVVLPLSSTGMPKFDDAPWVAGSIGMHILFGAMTAWFAGKALRRD